MRPVVIVFVLLVVAVLTFWVDLVYAEAIDEVINPKKSKNQWVSDMANIIDPASEAELNSTIDQLEQRTSAEIAVVAINRTDGRTPKEFATALFNKWGIGKAGKDNGILVILVLEARRIEIETGYGVEGILPDGKVGEILDLHVIPEFKGGNYSKGLLNGVGAIAKVITEGESRRPEGAIGSKEEALEEKLSKKTVFFSLLSYILCGLGLVMALLFGLIHRTMPAGGRSYRLAIFISGLVALIFGAAIISGAFFSLTMGLATALLVAVMGIPFWMLLKRYLRQLPSLCANCGKLMRLLTESQEDAYLKEKEILEEQLGSVDYNVWRCDACQTCEVKPHVRWFSRYSRCPRCDSKTLRTSSLTVREPTYNWAGLKEVTKKCYYKRCDYANVSQVAIPKLTKTTGGDSFGGGRSGGGSFGGGSSGGGGAGRSW